MANPIIEFLLGTKARIKEASVKKKSGAMYLATGDGNNAHLYYSDGSSIINVAPEFVESQSDDEIVITFNS